MHAQPLSPSNRTSRTPGLPALLIAAWVLAMISVPIVRWTIGDDALAAAVAIGVTLQAAATLAVLWRAWGLRFTLTTAATILPLAWALELAGSKTGFPFGSYTYTGALLPQLAGVPLLVPLAWLMMLPAAWAVAAALTGKQRGIAFLAVAAAAFTAWDLFLDPQMVAWGYWIWARPQGYFGIPWTNFGGWLLGSLALSAAVFLPPWRPPALPVRPLLAIYTITWLLQTVGLALFWGMPGPALVGFAVMGAFALLAWRAHLRKI